MEREICELIQSNNLKLAQQKIREGREQNLQINQILNTAVQYYKPTLLEDILDYPGLNINKKVRDFDLHIDLDIEFAAIHHAAKLPSPEILKKLIGRNADCNILTQGSDSTASTPLMLAIEDGRPANVQMILEQGVDLGLKNCVGANALIISATCNAQAERCYDRSKENFEEISKLFANTSRSYLDAEKILEINRQEHKRRLEVLLILCRHGALIGCDKFPVAYHPSRILVEDKEGFYSKEGVPICSDLGTDLKLVNFETPFLLSKKEADLNWPLDKLRPSIPESVSEPEIIDKLMLDLELAPTRLPTNLLMLKSRCLEHLDEGPGDPELLKILKYAKFRLGEISLRSLCLEQVRRDPVLRMALKLEQVNEVPNETVSTIDPESVEGNALVRFEANYDLVSMLSESEKERTRKIKICDQRRTMVLEMIKKRNRSLWPDDETTINLSSYALFFVFAPLTMILLDFTFDSKEASSLGGRRVTEMRNSVEPAYKVGLFISGTAFFLGIALCSMFFLMKTRSRSIKDQRLAILDSFDLEDKNGSGLGNDTVPTDLVRLDPDMDAEQNRGKCCSLPPCCATYPKYQSTKSYIAKLEKKKEYLIKGGFFSQRFFPPNETKNQDSQSLPKPT